MKNYYRYLAGVLIFFLSFGAVTAQPYQKVYTKTGGGASVIEISEVIDDVNGGYVSVGTIPAVGGAGDRIIIAKYTSGGSVSWSRIYAYTPFGGGDISGLSIAQNPDPLDEGFAIVGQFSNAVATSCFILKTDNVGLYPGSSGTTFFQELQVDYPAVSLIYDPTTYDLIVLSKGDAPFPRGHDLQLTWLDPNGSILNQYCYGTNAEEEAIEMTTDGEFIYILGHSLHGSNPDKKLIAVKIEFDGDQVAGYIYDPDYEVIGTDLAVDNLSSGSDGLLAITANTFDDPCQNGCPYIFLINKNDMTQIDRNAPDLSSINMTGGVQAFILNSICYSAANENFCAVGKYIESSSPDYRAGMLLVDRNIDPLTNGFIDLSLQSGSSLIDEDELNWVIPGDAALSGGYYAIGTTDATDIYVAFTDGTGTADCETKYAVNIDAEEFTETAIDSRVSASAALASISYTQSNYPLTDHSGCGYSKKDNTGFETC